MSHYIVKLDPAAIAKNRTELDLNRAGIALEHDGIDWGEAAIQAYMAQRKWGESPVAYRVPNRIITIPLALYGRNEAEEEAVRRKLEQKVGLLQRQGGVLLRQRQGGEPLYGDIVDAGLTVPDTYGEVGGVEPKLMLRLTCLPDLYGEPITLDAHSESGQNVFVLQQGGSPAVIQGDYPARTRIVVTEQAAQNQRTLLWGFRSSRYSSAATAKLFYDAYEMTQLNGAVTVSGAETFSGKAVLLKAPERNTWHPFLETKGPLTHIGSFKVLARVMGRNVEGQRLRLVWSNSSAILPTTNPAVRIKGTPGEGQKPIVDLGEIRIEESPTGEHWWRGVLQLETGSVANEFEVDRIWLQPLDDGAGELRATAIPSSTLLAPQAEPAAAESNSAMHAGKAWVNPTRCTRGHPGEYAEVPLGFSETSAALFVSNFGFSIPGTATIQGIGLSAESTNGGLLTVGTMQLVKAGALAGTVKEGGFGTPNGERGGSGDLWGTTWTPAQISASNFGIALWITNQMAIKTGTPHVKTVTLRIYYSIGASTFTQDAVLYASRNTEIRSEGSFREDTATTAYARVSEETGDLARMPPSGIEGREVQLFLKNSRGLIGAVGSGETAESDSSITDKTQVQVIYQPCFIGRI